MSKIGTVANGLFLWSMTRPVNRFFDLYTGGAARPVFFDVDQVRPDLRRFDRAFADIRGELNAILEERDRIPRYHDLDPLQAGISGATPGRWQVLMLNCMGRRIDRNCVRCPKTAALVDSTPDLFQAFFSILEPGKSIPAHSGIYRGYLRYHLGLKVPRENPPRIRVKDRTHEWREGESVVFDDSWEHQVYNDADDVRVVLIVDFLRPMPRMPDACNRLVRAYLRLHYAHLTLREPFFQ